MVSEVSVKPGESKMGCLPSRISMRVNNGDIEKSKDVKVLKSHFF